MWRPQTELLYVKSFINGHRLWTKCDIYIKQIQKRKTTKIIFETNNVKQSSCYVDLCNTWIKWMKTRGLVLQLNIQVIHTFDIHKTFSYLCMFSCRYEHRVIILTNLNLTDIKCRNQYQKIMFLLKLLKIHIILGQ